MLDLLCLGLHDSQISPKQLDRILGLDAGHGFLHIVLDRLREVKGDAGNLSQDGLDFFDQILLLVQCGPPLYSGPEIHQEFSIEKAGRIGAIVWSAQLGYDRGHLGETPEDGSDVCYQLGGLLERNVNRHRGAYPEVALLQRRHELTAQEGHDCEGHDHEAQRKGNDDGLMREGPTQSSQVHLSNPPNDSRVFFTDWPLE